MSTLVINPLRRSTSFALTTAVVLAITLLAARAGNTQQLQQGIHVQMAQTTTAMPMPDADNNDAWIVSVTADGTLYFGVDPLTPTELTNKMIRTPRRRDQNLYVKADARAPFAAVRTVLTTAHEMGFAASVLLTSQSRPSAPGNMVPPNGLEMLVDPALPSGSVTTVVQLNSGQQGPRLTINGDDIPWYALESTLREHFQKGDEKVGLLKADGQLPFGQVAHVIDTIHSLGAKVMISTPEL